jgi:type I restriction enzyme M protein
MPARSKSANLKDFIATIGFEAKVWRAPHSRSAAETAEGNRSNKMNSAKAQRCGAEQYNHVGLDLIFLKYISDTFEVHRATLLHGQGDYAGKPQTQRSRARATNSRSANPLFTLDATILKSR